jgi:uncharacterized membrane protein YphA (DoxX/SURF4 family)
MNINQFLKNCKTFIVKMNEKGVPVPMVSYKGEGNPALTLVVISATLVVVGLLSRWAGAVGGIDMTNAMQFFGISTTLFFGHTLVHKDVPGSKADGDDQK